MSASTIRPDAAKVRTYVANAATAALALLAQGYVEVSRYDDKGKKIGMRKQKITTYKQAYEAKTRSLATHLRYIQQYSSAPRSLKHKQNVRNWEAVNATFSQLTSIAKAKAAVKAAK